MIDTPDIQPKIHNADLVLFALDPATLRGMRLLMGQALDAALVRMSSLIYAVTGDKIENLKNARAEDWPLKAGVVVEASQLENLRRDSNKLEALECHGVDNWQCYGEVMACAAGEPCDVCGTGDDE